MKIPPKKNDFGQTKAKMGRFSQKGLCYGFEILHGLPSNKIIRIPMKKNNQAKRRVKCAQVSVRGLPSHLFFKKEYYRQI